MNLLLLKPLRFKLVRSLSLFPCSPCRFILVQQLIDRVSRLPKMFFTQCRPISRLLSGLLLVMYHGFSLCLLRINNLLMGQ